MEMKFWERFCILKQYPLSQNRKMLGMKNVIIHDYKNDIFGFIELLESSVLIHFSKFHAIVKISMTHGTNWYIDYILMQFLCKTYRKICLHAFTSISFKFQLACSRDPGNQI